MSYRKQSSFDCELYSREKMQFYPTNPNEVTKIASMFDFSEKDFTVLEPCCGDGTAVEAFVRDEDGMKRNNAIVFGVELDKKRYETHLKDNEQIDYVINSDFLHIECSRKSFSLVFCNTPYGADVASGSRIENEFLKKLTGYVSYDGYLVWIVPVKLLRDYEVSRKALANRYEISGVYKFCEPEFSKFQQVAVIGRLRSNPLTKKESENFLYESINAIDSLITLDEVEKGIYKVRPNDPDNIKVFRGTELDNERAVGKLSTSPLFKVLHRDLKVDSYGVEVERPPLMPNADQLFTMIAIGRAAIKKVTGNILQRGVVKEYTSSESYEHKGETYIKEVTFSKSTLTLIEATGKIVRLDR